MKFLKTAVHACIHASFLEAPVDVPRHAISEMQQKTAEDMPLAKWCIGSEYLGMGDVLNCYLQAELVVPRIFRPVLLRTLYTERKGCQEDEGFLLCSNVNGLAIGALAWVCVALKLSFWNASVGWSWIEALEDH